MSTQAPKPWESIADAMPIVRDIVSWNSIREWSLSSVHRTVMRSGLTAIAKRSSGPMKGEFTFYQSVLSPLEIEHPQIYAGAQTDIDCFMVMEDLGMESLETQPSQRHFIAAANKLGQIHATATMGIHGNRIAEEVWRGNYRDGQAFIRDAQLLERCMDLPDADRGLLRDIVSILPNELNLLYSGYPVTLVHSDYYAKNLVIYGDDIRVIDWTNAYFSPHLGDVYGLGREGNMAGVAVNDILSAYCTSVGKSLGDPDTLLWRIHLGGVCWSVQSIWWVLTHGVRLIPGSAAWIPDMMKDLRDAVDGLRGCTFA